MLGVLALIVTVAPIVSLGTAGLREEIDYAMTDVVATRLRWVAEGCLAHGAAMLDSAVASGGVSVLALGGNMTRDLAGAAGETTCRLLIGREPATTSSLVPLERDSIAMLLATAALSPAVRDSLTDALVDWQDADTIRRSAGAERTWYATAGRLAPRNGPIAAIEELALVRGLEADGRRAEVLAALERRSPDCDTVADRTAPPMRPRRPAAGAQPVTAPGACSVARLSATAIDRAGASVTVTAVVQHTGHRTAFIELRGTP